MPNYAAALKGEKHLLEDLPHVLTPRSPRFVVATTNRFWNHRISRGANP
jgi:hypothetical protein